MINVRTPTPKPPPMKLSPASDCQEKALNWLWRGYVARGKPEIIEGDPDMGKGLITIDIIARITRGDSVPLGNDKFPAGRVLLTPGEDDWDDTIMPRLIAAGARLDRVYKLQHPDGRHFMFPNDLNALGAYIEQVTEAEPDPPITSMVVDPLNAHIADYNNPVKLRRHLTELGGFCGRYGITNIAVRHLSKDDDMKNPLYRGSGYIDISGAARLVLQVWDAPGQQPLRGFVPAKNNLGKKAPALLYQVVGVPARDRYGNDLLDDRGHPTTVGCVQWVGTSTLTAKQFMRGQVASQKAEAERWLEETLTKNGPMLRKALQAAAEQAGFKWPTVREASGNIDNLCKAHTRTFPKQGIWYLSEDGAHPSDEQLQALVEQP